MTTTKIISAAKVIALALVLAVGIRSISAFSNPPGAPTACPTGYPGCDAPLNTGPLSQTKIGSLVINGSTTAQYGQGLQVWGSTLFNGAIQIADGSQHSGYVLTSDSNGNASWAAPTGGSGGSGSVVTGTSPTFTLPAGTWTLSVFLAYPNCTDKNISLQLDGATIASRVGFGDQQGCTDSTVSGTVTSLAGGSHTLSIIGQGLDNWGNEQFYHWVATGGTATAATSSFPNYDVASVGFTSLAANQGFFVSFNNDSTVLCGLGYYSSGFNTYSDGYGRNPGAIICAPSVGTAAYTAVASLAPVANHNPSGSASIGSTNYNYSGDTRTANQYCVVQGYTTALSYAIGSGVSTVWKWNGSSWTALSGTTVLASATCGR